MYVLVYGMGICFGLLSTRFLFLFDSLPGRAARSKLTPVPYDLCPLAYCIKCLRLLIGRRC